MNIEFPWIIIDKYFEDNKYALVKHHLDSYNDFFNKDIHRIFKEKNPIKILKQQDPVTREYNLQANLYLAGKDGKQIYYGKPVIYDEDREHYMFPNEARLRNMTYGITIHIDVVIEYVMIEDGDGESIEAGKKIKTELTSTLEKVYFGKFPIMLNSDLCILRGLDPVVKFNMGECKNDIGGYFIIDGKEKVIVPQEKFADNMLYIRDSYSDIYSHSAEIRSVSEDASKPTRTLSIRIVTPTNLLSNNQIVVNVPNVRKAVPLFILMRALGVVSDKEIINMCLLDMEKYKHYIDLFIPSIHDAGRIFSQETALEYIKTFTKGKTTNHVLEILMNYFLPNIGETNFRDKAFFIGYMVLELLKVFTKEKKATDRDSFKFKRVELPGVLLYDLFKEYYSLHQKHIFQKIDKEYYYKEGTYQNNFLALIEPNQREIFKERITESGFKKAFKGNWGSEAHTKKSGVVQDLNRLSFNGYISHMRKINLPLDASAKVVGPRLLHGSQWGIIDPVDTPDGGNIGLHKHMAISAHITSSCSSVPIIKFFKNNLAMKVLCECDIAYIANSNKVIINGAWVGIVEFPEELIKMIKHYRRLALLPIFTSVFWQKEDKTLFVYTDAGRLCRPIFYVEDDKPSYAKSDIMSKILARKFSWIDLVTGFNKKKVDIKTNSCEVYYDLSELYGEGKVDTLVKQEAIIEYLDTSEEEGTLICMSEDKLKNNSLYTHLEIHPSLILGVMGNQIVFPENNQLPRDLFSCGQSKQAVSLYHSNYLNRIDKMGVVLNYGEIPLVKSRYLKYISNEEHPYGENVIVAIGIYGSYNVEDSILFNEGSVNRGLFRTTYYNMYESREESSKIGNSTVDTKFANIESENVVGLRPGYDYSELDAFGLIKENTRLDDKKVLIGQVTNDVNTPGTYIDGSKFPKKGQLGYVDKSFITEGEEGSRIAKVRIREERIPGIGDKFCSRCGQKGTVGLIIPEESMPFTADGIRPDIIINPHALPSRMTIGQLVETLMGKACAMYGGFGDCTAFMNKGPKTKVFGDLLTNIGFNSTGNELLYNGETGEQLEMSLYMGPTYYMRLKHMVKDKINYRARGPRTAITRQTVQGRANDGGLRIGEMERDGVVSHGMSHFLYDSLMNRGDGYYMAICNKTGSIAIYNETRNLFLSPLADGPIKFTGLIEDDISIKDVSKFGRTFSIVYVPYTLKLLMQELQTMNICMKLITEDNIDQIESMSFSNNVNIVLGKKESPEPKSVSKTSRINVRPSVEKEKEKEKELEKEAYSDEEKEAEQEKELENQSIKLDIKPIEATGAPELNDDEEDDKGVNEEDDKGVNDVEDDKVLDDAEDDKVLDDVEEADKEVGDEDIDLSELPKKPASVAIDKTKLTNILDTITASKTKEQSKIGGGDNSLFKIGGSNDEGNEDKGNSDEGNYGGGNQDGGNKSIEIK